MADSRCKSLCEDPKDLSMLILRLATKCLPKKLEIFRYVLYLCRAVIGISLDGVELIILKSVLAEYTKDNIGLDVGLILGISALTIASIIVVTYTALPVLRLETPETPDKQRAVDRYFNTFKAVNLTLTLIILAGTIYGRKNIDIEEASHIFLLISLGLDVLMDPIELIFGCYKVCGTESQGEEPEGTKQGTNYNQRFMH